MSTPNCSRFPWLEARTGVTVTLTYKNKRPTRLTVTNALIAPLLFPPLLKSTRNVLAYRRHRMTSFRI